MPFSLSEAAPSAAAPDPVKDVDLASFMAEVIEASRKRPVVVDFWSARSAPCKQMMPVLEKLVRATKGALTLAKVDIDRNAEIAQQLGVESVPAVFAFFQGRPVDGFMGALPEAQIKSWLDRLLKAAGGAPGAAPDDAINVALKQAADFLAAGNTVAAQSIYTDILEAVPDNVAAYAGLLRCFIASGDIAQAKDMLAKIPPEMGKDKAFIPVRTAIELAEQAAQGGSTAELQAKVDKNPADHQARLDLAMAHYAAGQKEQAVDQLLDLVRRDRAWNEAAGRKQLVKLFEAFGPTDPLTIAARKKLSSILFS